MKRKGLGFVYCILVASMLCGCTDAIPQLTEDESAMVSEYAAAKLLSYDKMYHSRLLDDEQLLKAQTEREEKIARENAIAEYLKSQAEEDAKESEQSDSADGQSGEKGEAKPQKSLAEVLGLDGIEVTYLKKEICDTYPSDAGQISGNNVNDPLAAFFAMNATPGHKLLVAKYEISNTTSGEAGVDMLSKKVRFAFSADSFKKKSALVTMLEDDFSTMSRTLLPGEKMEVAILGEIPADGSDSLSGVSLSVKCGEESANFPLD